MYSFPLCIKPPVIVLETEYINFPNPGIVSLICKDFKCPSIEPHCLSILIPLYIYLNTSVGVSNFDISPK